VAPERRMLLFSPSRVQHETKKKIKNKKERARSASYEGYPNGS
jgi:hypothetical protein